MTYRLVDHGYPFKKIMRGKQWIGRVVKHATDNCYLGIIGDVIVRAPTSNAAFALVVARHLGFKDAAEMDDRNRAVRAATRVQRQRSRYLADRFVNAKTFNERVAVLDEVFGLKIATGSKSDE